MYHPGMALAYLITWTVYGTWLPGDPRESVNSENRRGAPFETPNAARVAHHRDALEAKPRLLRAGDRKVVSSTIEEVCAVRGWSIHATSVRSNHAHVVLSCEVAPEKAMVDLKAWATRRLREHDPERFAGRVLTKHGSTRYLFYRWAVEKAIEYVLLHQDRR